MAVNAFLLVNVRPNSVSRPSEELKQIPGVSRVEEVSGIYDFLVETEATVHFTQISDTLMAKPWVKRVHVLRPIRTENAHTGKSDIIKPISDNNKTIENRLIRAQSWLYPTL